MQRSVLVAIWAVLSASFVRENFALEIRASASATSKDGDTEKSEKSTDFGHICDAAQTVIADSYSEAERPRAHFTPKSKWMSEPHGLVFGADKNYHLFFSKSAEGKSWSKNLVWGHAISKDFMNWEQVKDAHFHDKVEGMLEGSIVMDYPNTSGLLFGNKVPMVAAYSADGALNIAYSVDNGKDWKDVPGVGGPPFTDSSGAASSDPKMFFHMESKKWIMLVATQDGALGLYSSANFLSWTHMQSIFVDWGTNGVKSNSPDLFQLPVTIDGEQTSRWVLWLGDGWYQIGTFDGRKFENLDVPRRVEYGRGTGAATYNGEPLGRRLQFQWLRPNKEAFMTGNGQFEKVSYAGVMGFPTELDLVQLPSFTSEETGGEPFVGGFRLRRQPAKELMELRTAPAIAKISTGRRLSGEAVSGTTLSANNAVQVAALTDEAVDVRLRMNLFANGPTGMTLHVRGMTIDIIGYDANVGGRPKVPPGMCPGAMLSADAEVGPKVTHKSGIQNMPICAESDGTVELRVLQDRTTLEIYDLVGGQSMSLYSSMPCVPSTDEKSQSKIVWETEVALEPLEMKTCVPHDQCANVGGMPDEHDQCCSPMVIPVDRFEVYEILGITLQSKLNE